MCYVSFQDDGTSPGESARPIDVAAQIVGLSERESEAFDKLTQKVSRALRTAGIFAHDIGAVRSFFEDGEAVASDAYACDGSVAEQIFQTAFLDGPGRITFEIDEVCKPSADGDAIGILRNNRPKGLRECALNVFMMFGAAESRDLFCFAVADGVFDRFGTDIYACIFHGKRTFMSFVERRRNAIANRASRAASGCGSGDKPLRLCAAEGVGGAL